MTAQLLEIIGAYAPDSDSDRTLERAAEYAVFPLVYLARKQVGAHLNDRDRGFWREHVTRIALIRNELRQVRDVLGSDIPNLLLKGEPLARQLYGDSYSRSTTDIDILLSQEHVDLAWRRLEALGYRADEGVKPNLWASNQFALYHPRHHVAVEIHWRIAYPQMPCPSTTALLENAALMQLSDPLQVPVLSPEMLFFQLCYHYHQHQGFLKGLFDIAAWFDRYGETANLEAIAHTARDLRVMGVLQWPIHALVKLTGQSLPLYEPEVDLPVRIWSDLCVSVTRNCLVRPQVSLRDQAILRTMAGIGKVPGVLVGSMAMLTLDGVAPKAIGFMRLWVWGPHRLGRFFHRVTRPLAALERQFRSPG
ncbi:MAG: nucleotidyltransferase family protein [Bradymonadaceae bacterium]|nr:nucleotidyltransferase family protein [Lujinxingiaceae bacterium]